MLHKLWDMHLSTLTHTYNTATNEATQLPPFEIIFGHQGNSSFDVTNTEDSDNTNEYVKTIAKNRQVIRQMVQQQLKKIKNEQC
jgi:hypothetical protein